MTKVPASLQYSPHTPGVVTRGVVVVGCVVVVVVVVVVVDVLFVVVLVVGRLISFFGAFSSNICMS